MPKRNPLWQQVADQTWYVYVSLHNGSLKKMKYEQGQAKASRAAKSFTLNPAVKSVTVYSSKLARKRGVAERFLWTRERGWY